MPQRTHEMLKNFYTDIVINYKLDKSGIKDTFNRAIAEAFKGNFDIPEYDVKMTLTKSSDAAVEIEGQNILVVVPIHIQVLKKTFLTNFKAQGTLEMSFISELIIDSMWNSKTKTSLSHHRWIEKPKLSVLGIDLPITAISNVVIDKSKPMIETGIDDAVRENLTLKQKMKETMAIFNQAIPLDPDSKTWLKIDPEKIHLNKVINSRFTAAGKIQLIGRSTLTSYKPKEISSAPAVPKMYWKENIPDSSVFRVYADIKTMDINAILSTNLNGQTFTANDKSITLSNIITNTDYENIRVVTDVAGAVNGTLIIKGKPKYDAVANAFYMEDIDIQLKTKNVIHKAAAWIGEGKIRNELEKKLRFSITETLVTVQNKIDQHIETFNKKYDLEMKVAVGSADVESFELKPGQIEALMKAKFYLELKIKDLKSFKKF